MSDWIPAIITGGFAIASWALLRASTKKEEIALGYVREATTAYRDATHEHQEAHRILQLALDLLDSEAPSPAVGNASKGDE